MIGGLTADFHVRFYLPCLLFFLTRAIALGYHDKIAGVDAPGLFAGLAAGTHELPALEPDVPAVERPVDIHEHVFRECAAAQLFKHLVFLGQKLPVLFELLQNTALVTRDRFLFLEYDDLFPVTDKPMITSMKKPQRRSSRSCCT